MTGILWSVLVVKNKDKNLCFTCDLRFTPNWKLLSLFVLLLPVLLSLGNWQLMRAEEKRQIKQQQIERAMLPPVAFSELKEEKDVRYRQVAIDGEFVHGKTLLLDNRIRSGRVGYEVIEPFLLSTGEYVLVNRGWLEAPRLRSQSPDVTTVKGPVALTGVAYQPLLNTAKESAYIEQDERWPKVIQAVDHAAISAVLGVKVPAFTIRLQQGVTGSLNTGWPVINVQPEKHVAYSVQWFLMALALLILTLLTNTNILMIRKHKINHKETNND